jgi:hypothetical protein
MRASPSRSARVKVGGIIGAAPKTARQGQAFTSFQRKQFNIQPGGGL